ncbi:MAG: Ldh family oxidoreductase [Granulosicoccus sp.]
MTDKYQAEALVQFATQVLEADGMQPDMAQDVAHVLVEGDLFGHDTHGLALLAPYVMALQNGRMLGAGDIEIISQRAAVATWNGDYLPGPWLVKRGLDWAQKVAREFGTATLVIRKSSHIAALAAYLEQPARDGFMVQLMCSDPSVASVAPFGGTEPLVTPNPMSFGIPTTGAPIMIDISASITTNGMTNRLQNAGEKGAHNWWLDANGVATSDPSVLNTDPPGSLMPLGGVEAGHKGYSLALFVESMTSALAGHGRADDADRWGATVYLQLTDCEAFGGLSEFERQTQWLVDHSLANKPADKNQPVRVPGQRALARKAEQLRDGVLLHSSIAPELKRLAEASNIAMPEAVRP